MRHLGGRGEVDDRVSPFLCRDGERLSHADDIGEQAAAPIPEASGAKSWRETVGGDGSAGPATRELARVQDVAELGAPVDLESAIALSRLEIVEVEPGASVGVRGSVDHSPWRRRNQPIAQAVRQHDIGHVVERKGTFQAVLGHLTGAEQRARIVDEDVDSRFGRGNLGRDPLHLDNSQEIGIVDAVREARSALAQPCQHRLTTDLVARHENQARPHTGQPLRRDLPDSGRRPGDDDNLPLHGASSLHRLTATVAVGESSRLAAITLSQAWLRRAGSLAAAVTDSANARVEASVPSPYIWGA